jgi:hypothetical protein
LVADIHRFPNSQIPGMDSAYILDNRKTTTPAIRTPPASPLAVFESLATINLIVRI